MKILIIQDYLRSGGTERQSVLLANAFADAGHLVTLLTFRPRGALTDTVNARVTRHALQPFDLKLDWFAPGLRGFVSRAAPDVILCMGRMANCHAGSLQARLPNTAVIATMRTGKNLPAQFRRSLHRSRHVVANSREARDALIRDHAVPAKKITVIHNSLIFPASSSIQEVRDRMRHRHGADADTAVLLCVAMFRPEKNQRELIETVAGLPLAVKWQLWLAGAGPTRNECEQFAIASGFGQRIKFLGFHPDPTPFYHAADLAVHASWSEGLSNFLIEAQAHGLPFVAYEAQGIRECCVPNQTGWLISRNDRAAFQAAIVQQTNADPATRSATSAAARAFAGESFDPARQVSAYVDLFTRLV